MFKYLSAVGLLLVSGAALAQKPNPTVKSDKYVIELRMPDQGLFSGEETDIEFRLMDSTKNDEILGMAGVPGAVVSAKITMPEMPGMPVVKPAIHAEGVPGDYGVVAYFPHGGQYQLDLVVTPPSDKPIKASFKLDVSDERPKGIHKPPYELLLVGGQKPQAGAPFELAMQVRSTKDKSVVKTFDEAHTKFFHLLLASKDFVWFLHEHPEMDSDGTWRVKVTFPAGGEYLVYGDVAPSGKGSQILPARLLVSGPAPTWKPSWQTRFGPSVDGNLKANLVLPSNLAIGRMGTIHINVVDAGSGSPITDLEPYLGAMGHLMIFSQDGKTVVHSHPDESAAAKPGVVAFNARFPKAGLYRAFAQFQRAGQIHTVSFTFEVKK